MTIKYLRHKEIDKSLWDNCIRNAPNGNICALSWFLDTTCRHWDALVTDDYSAVFPLTHHSKAGISYLSQPPFSQQLGLFTRGFVTPELLESFLVKIPSKYKLAEINLNKWCKEIPAGFNPVDNVSFELDLIYPYRGIENNYSDNVRRNLRKAARSNIYLSRHVRPDEITELFAAHRGRTIKNMKRRHYRIIHDIMHHTLKDGTGEVWGAFDQNDALCAAIFIAGINEREIFLFSAVNQTGRDTAAMFLLIDNYIRLHAERPLILDFEGSNDVNLARFYASFGAKKYLYHGLQLNNLPYLVRLFHSIYKKLKYSY